MKKRGWLLGIILLLLLTAGVTLALMLHSTEELRNLFTPAQVSCEITLGEGTSGTSSVTVANTGNIASYIRIRVISYWQDGEGHTVGKASELPTLSITSDWLAGEESTYYYPVPVEVDESTPNLLSSPCTLKSELYNGETVYQVIEFLAEAVQAKPDQAISEAWNVTVSESRIDSLS